jgi:hypothetical protein
LIGLWFCLACMTTYEDPDSISNLFGISDYIRRYTITYPYLPNNNFPVGNSRFVVIPNLPHNITKQADSRFLVWQSLPNNKITDEVRKEFKMFCQTISGWRHLWVYDKCQTTIWITISVIPKKKPPLSEWSVSRGTNLSQLEYKVSYSFLPLWYSQFRK